ncbi:MULTISPECIES: hypothetical protein [unclassified Pantoea]|uniref:hypothetical protein n=1 Tax=unclassified Pantoea TaxID=2630326 RepID=UPI001CD22994|nr:MULTISPECIES: hypothetical protein [unclassified Pantoea]MCA1175038.1 hypothetical protein [Pantoea sp. alder69]MCA1250000.1 hypothetical protein [Pantoea sp. alder70]MCA1264045.1 hypothetical protein [Pantoea sp. alder81]
MTKSSQRAKWILALLCLVLAFCLAQRSFNLPTASQTTISASSISDVDSVGGEKLCSISAKSLHAAAPVIDSTMPFLLMVIALLTTLFSSKPTTGYRREPLFPPVQRRHLTFCVFRE